MHHTTSPMSEAPILVALDLGEHCRECLAQAWRIAEDRGQTLIVAHIAHETAQTAGFYQRKNPGDSMLPIPEIAKNLLADFIETFSQDHPAFRTMNFHQVVVSGIPETRIPELARRFHAGAIVLGDRQHSGIASLLQRSLGQTVLNSAPCPLFLLNGSDKPLEAKPIPPRSQPRTGFRAALHLR